MRKVVVTRQQQVKADSCVKIKQYDNIV